ncbi:alanine--glyoxylate aminotransferase family protein [Paracoccus sp. M683]|uniref:pyridoxal-phosphate-dependent aminotransferase family protein n=1 Tax=Paracoccus sp. M683 TaxID=2594268 RepID=UPI0011813CCE|nr:aminotransferase class V-fold PLP-dependent enzyme [Paracoccus sp. M683]TRW99357.1 alanine--glyoxylate aminotransferase family protein [Paracoccus sp. M683]
MSLSAGHPIIAIPGPSPVPARVLRAMHRVSPDIYGAEVLAVVQNVVARLKQLAGTAAHVAPYIGNGHAGWEAVTSNLFNRDDRVLVIQSGHFGRSWADVMTRQGVAVEAMDFGLAPPDPARLAERLARPDAAGIVAVCVCQTDTASSARADIQALKAAMGDHPALLVVDAIASLGCAPMKMDDWGVDVLIAASQKGLMCPPGLCFAWFSDRVVRRGRTGLTTPYWDWHPRATTDAAWQFWGGTPPVQLVYALDEALRMLLEEEGLEAAWARHETLARACWAAFDAWGAGNPAIRLVVADPECRAHAVTAVQLPQADELRAWLTERLGVTLGVGLGAADPANALRVAHMGHANAPMLLGTLASMQAGMTALGIAHGPGGIDAAIRVIAERA